MKNKSISPLRSIRLKCLDCMAGSSNEVKLCVSPDCALFPFRFGKRPEGTYKKRVLSEEQKEVLRKRFAKSIGREPNPTINS